jgi:hypothetical protein
MSAFAQHITFTSPLYMVMFDRGRFGFEGVTYPEHSKLNIIEDIACGGFEKVVSVLELQDGHYADITDEVREAVETLSPERRVA